MCRTSNKILGPSRFSFPHFVQRMSAAGLSLRFQFLEQRLGVFQIGGVEALGEPVVDSAELNTHFEIHRTSLQQRPAGRNIPVEAAERPRRHELPDVIDPESCSEQRAQGGHIDSGDSELDRSGGFTVDRVTDRAQERKLEPCASRGNRPDAARLAVPRRAAGGARIVGVGKQPARRIGDRRGTSARTRRARSDARRRAGDPKSSHPDRPACESRSSIATPA